MSAITKQIAAVEFHVNARQANAALESMRQSAEDAREEMSQLQEQANKGVKTVMVGGKDMDITKRIRDLNATAKAFEQAAQSQIKGVKAWDELWQHAKMGNIEQLTGQQIKAGVNGAKRQYDRLILGDEEDRRKAAAIRDIIDQANIVLDKLKGDTDKVIQTLSDGGHVADEVLQREKKNLEDMLSLTEKFSPEWQDYNRQLQAITKGIEEQAAQEKRLRGELVDANDARREAAKLDEDVAQAAKEQHAAQQQVIDDAQKQMQQYQEQRRQHQESAQKITDEIAKQDRQIASQSQLVESIKRENHERTKKSNVMVQEADQADKTAAKAKRAADSSAKVVERFSDKLQKAKDDVAKLQEQLDKLGSETETPKVDTSKVDALKKQIEGLKAEYKQLSSDWIKAEGDRNPHKMYASYEDFAKEASKKKGYDFEMDKDQYLEKMRERRAAKFKDMVGDEVFGSDAYLRINDIAAGHTEEDDLIGQKQAKTILAGQKAYSDACDKATSAIIQAHANLRRAFDDNLQPEQVQNIAKQLHKLQELYRQLTDIGFSRGIGFGGSGKDVVKDMFEGTGTDFDKEVSKAEAQIKRTLTTAEKQKYDYYDKTFEKERNDAKQKQTEIEKRQEQIKKDLANAERDLANAEKEHSAESAKSNSEREAVVVKLTKALDKQSKAEETLKQKEKEAADAQELYNRANADAVAKHEALDKAKAEGNKKLQEESQKLSQLQGKREANVASLNKEKEAIRQKNEAVDAQAKIINDAQQTQAKSRQLSIESIEKSITLLKQENRVIGDETNPQWVENEKTIGRLNQRLSEMKQRAAELRGEAMSVSQAMDMSNIVSGQRVRDVEPADSRVERATAKTRETLANIEGEIGRVNGDMEKLNAEMDKIGNRSTNLNPFVESLQKTNTLLHEQEERRKATADGFAKEAEQRQKAIAAQKEQVELLKNEKQSAVTGIDQRIQAMQARMAELQGYEIKPKDYKQVVASIQDEIKKLEEEKAAIENSAETKQRFADANRKLAQLIKEDSEATASEKAALEKLDEQIANTQSEMKKLGDSVPGFDLDDIQHYAAELSKLNEYLSKLKQERSSLSRIYTTEQAEREKAIQAQKDEIALMRRQKEEAISSINARIEAGRKMLETLNALPSEERTNGPAKGMLDSTHQTIRELYAQRDSIIKESDAKIEQATSKYASLMKANEEATAKAETTLRKYDEQIYATQQQISEFAQKLSSVKGPVDAKEFEESSKQMDKLKNKLASLTAERQKYTDQLQRETEEATRLAEAEKAAAEAEQKGVSIEQMEKAISVLQQAQRATTNDVDASRYTNAIDNLTQKLKEAKGNLKGGKGKITPAP